MSPTKISSMAIKIIVAIITHILNHSLLFTGRFKRNNGKPINVRMIDKSNLIPSINAKNTCNVVRSVKYSCCAISSTNLKKVNIPKKSNSCDKANLFLNSNFLAFLIKQNAKILRNSK